MSSTARIIDLALYQAERRALVQHLADEQERVEDLRSIIHRLNRERTNEWVRAATAETTARRWRRRALWSWGAVVVLAVAWVL